MKHIIILGDGMADWAVKSLGDKTLLQYAKTPYMDKLARMGRNGRLITVADGFHPGSEVANMSVLGYNLPKVYEGHGPLEAASIGVDLQPGVLARRDRQAAGYTAPALGLALLSVEYEGDGQNTMEQA